jgi:hypothetical protein
MGKDKREEERREKKSSLLRATDFVLTDRERRRLARKVAKKAAKRAREEAPPPHPQGESMPPPPPPPPPTTPAPPRPPTPRPPPTPRSPTPMPPTSRADLLVPTTAATDRDQVISDAVVEDLKEKMEQQRGEQRTAALLRRKEELQALVASGKLTQGQADSTMEKEREQKEDVFGYTTAKTDSSTARPSLLIGKSNLPTTRNQTW